MIDEHGRAMCDECGCFVESHFIELPSGKSLGPKHAAFIWCAKCAQHRENPTTGLEKPGMFSSEDREKIEGKGSEDDIRT